MSSTKSKPRSTQRSLFKKLVSVFLWLTFVLAVFVGAGSWYLYQGLEQLKQPVRFEADRTFEVYKGETLRKVANRLEKEKLIRSSKKFYWYGRYKSYDRKIKAGEFLLSSEGSEIDLYAALISGKSQDYSITFIEGWTVRDAIAEIVKHPKIKQTLKTDDPIEIAKLLKAKYGHAEGLIFPDTYYYHKGVSDLELLKRAYSKMQNVVQELWEEKSDNAAVTTPYQALILASIIEKETSASGERKQISGVFTTRLQKGMKLQTDPTVIYGLGDKYTGNLTRKHLKQPTSYNTYVIKGLPPTPIALPGFSSIQAALNPDITGHIFFVAKGDGTHAFSKTLKEHNRAVRQYQLKRRKDYKSSP